MNKLCSRKTDPKKSRDRHGSKVDKIVPYRVHMKILDSCRCECQGMGGMNPDFGETTRDNIILLLDIAARIRQH